MGKHRQVRVSCFHNAGFQLLKKSGEESTPSSLASRLVSERKIFDFSHNATTCRKILTVFYTVLCCAGNSREPHSSTSPTALSNKVVVKITQRINLFSSIFPLQFNWLSTLHVKGLELKVIIQNIALFNLLYAPTRCKA